MKNDAVFRRWSFFFACFSCDERVLFVPGGVGHENSNSVLQSYVCVSCQKIETEVSNHNTNHKTGAIRRN